ncbi:MAG: radical SAM protein, partial [Clostridiales bacterium]|nr:radical SAM protein [Clostridiales bacterium]
RKVYSGVTFGEDNVSILNDLLKAEKPIEEIVANQTMPVFEPKRSGFFGFLRGLYGFAEKHLSINQSDAIFLIKVSTGCLGACSFCAVRKSRGHIQSKNVEAVISELRNGLRSGYRYFGLLATDLGAYGRDLGVDLADLLLRLVAEEGDFKIGIRNINPLFLIEMFEKLQPVFESDKVWFLSSAVESGSNRILKLMNRKYTVQDFSKIIKILNEKYPKILLRTQFMVGFPTETSEDFQMSLKLLDDLSFDWVEVFDFSVRDGTPAALMNGQIPNKVKKLRLLQLTFKALGKNPIKRMKQLVLSFLRSPCERQGWLPPS